MRAAFPHYLIDCTYWVCGTKCRIWVNWAIFWDDGRLNFMTILFISGAVTLCTDTWTPESGLVTAAFKLKRKPIQDFYQKDLKRMYGARCAWAFLDFSQVNLKFLPNIQVLKHWILSWLTLESGEISIKILYDPIKSLRMNIFISFILLMFALPRFLHNMKSKLFKHQSKVHVFSFVKD